jgi:hypothetical protein
MAKKKDDKTKRGITREQLLKIWPALGIVRWFEIAKANKPDHRFAYVNNTTLKGLCINPQHTDTQPSFHIFPEKGYAHCLGCGYYTQNPIKLISLLLDCTEADALQFLQEKQGMSFLGKKLAAELEAQRLNQLTKQAIYDATHEAMCETLADPSVNNYANNALDWLINQRGIPKDVLHALPVGIMPSLTELVDRINKDYLKKRSYHKANPGTDTPVELAELAVKYLENTFKDSKYCGSVLWPLHATPTEIARIKLRVPHNNPQKDIAFPDDEFEDLLGLYGLGWPLYHTFTDPKTQTDAVYLTEGEMDVMSLMARWVLRGAATFPLFSVGGKGGTAHIEPILRACGISRAFIVGDSPAGKGDTVVQGWLGRVRAINCSVFNHEGWDQLSPANDLDEAVVQHGPDKVEAAIWKTTQYFETAWKWAVNRATDDIEGIPDDDMRQRLEAAASHGKYLRNHIDCTLYTEEVNRRYPQISPSLLKQEIIKREDTELGFIASCTDVLREKLSVIASIPSMSNGRHLLLYDKKYRQLRRVRIDSDQSLVQELAPMFGMPYQFIKDHVGFPSFIETPENTEGLVMQRLDKTIRGVLKNALANLAEGAPEYDSLPHYRQGYHFIRGYDGRTYEYLVCGPQVFAIERDVTGIPTYRELDCPAENNVIFDIRSTDRIPWYPGGLSTQILEEGKKADLLKLFKDLEHFFSVGFKFKNHEVTCTLLAGIMMSMPIMNALPRQLLLFVTGESASGKSNLMAAFCGIHYPALRLLYASQGWDNFSAVGVFRNAEADSRLMALDEFEYTNAEKAEHVRKILEMVRGLVTNDAHRIIAKQGGGTEEAHYRLPMMFAAISGAEKPQDLNRLLIIETNKVDGRDKPENILRKEIGPDGIKQMAQTLAVGMYPHVPSILTHYREIDESFILLQSKANAVIEQRYASSLFGALAVMKHLGLDWETFFLKFIEQNAPTIQRAASVSESENYLKAMLFNSVIFRDETKTSVSIAHLLANPERREDVNASGCGTYYDKQSNCLMFVVEQVITKLLPSHYRYRGAMTATRLKEVLSRHRLALTTSEVQHSNILARATPYLGAGIQPEDVVVVHADPWLVEGNKVANAAMSEPMDVEPEAEQENAEAHVKAHDNDLD